MPRKTRVSAWWTSSTSGFNEAAARCRGKLDLGRYEEAMRLLASMRPRPDAAENRLGRAIVCTGELMLQ